MRIKCVRLAPTERQAKQLGKNYYSNQQVFGLTLGKEYLVFCLEILDGIAWVHLDSGTNRLSIAPLCLFEIVDGSVSKYWEFRLWKDNNFLFRPPSFYEDFFHDDLAEGVPKVVAEFQKIRAMLEKEI